MPTALPRTSTGRGTVPQGVSATLTVGGSTTTLTATSISGKPTLVLIGNLPAGATDYDLNTLLPPTRMGSLADRYIFVPTTGTFAKIVARPGEFIIETEYPVAIAGADFDIVYGNLQSASILNTGSADGKVAAFSEDGTAGYVDLVVGESTNIGKQPLTSRGRFIAAWAYDATGTSFKINESTI